MGDCPLRFCQLLHGTRHGILSATAFSHTPCTCLSQLFVVHKLLYTLSGQSFSSFLASFITHTATTMSLTQVLAVVRLPKSDIKDRSCSMNNSECFSLWFNHQHVSNYTLELTSSYCSVLTVLSPNHLSPVLNQKKMDNLKTWFHLKPAGEVPWLSTSCWTKHSEEQQCPSVAWRYFVCFDLFI